MRRSPDGAIQELVPSPFNARTRVHEYGGAAFTAGDGTLYFSNFADGRLYRLDRGDTEPRPITPAVELRYADAVIDKSRNRLLCVREDHTREGREATNTIVALNPNNDPTGGTVLIEGCNFYSSPRISPDGAHLAWLQWNHPNMPWDGCELWLGDFDREGRVTNRVKIAGGATEAICQPEWSPDGISISLMSKQAGGTSTAGRMAKPPPCILCKPSSAFPTGCSARLPTPSSRPTAWFAHTVATGVWSVAALDTRTGEIRELNTPFTDFSQVRAMPGYAVVVAGSPSDDTMLARINLDSGAVEILKKSGNLADQQRLHIRCRAYRVPYRGRAHSLRLLLRTEEPRFRRPRGRKASPPRHEPRRANLIHLRRAQPPHPVLDKPRHRRTGRELWRQHRLRARVPSPP